MKSFRNIIHVLGIAIMCLGCSFANQPNVNDNQPYEYKEVYQRIFEPYASGFVLQENVFQTTHNEHVYEFQSSITESLRAVLLLHRKNCACC